MKLFVTFTDKESLAMLRENIERLPESELENCQILLINYGDINNNGMVVESLNLSYAIFYVHKNKDDIFMIKNYVYHGEDRNRSVSNLFLPLFAMTYRYRYISFAKLFKKYIDSCYNDCNNGTTFDTLELFMLFSKCYDEVENDTDVRYIRDIIYCIIANLFKYPVFLYKDSEQWDYDIPYRSREYRLARKKCNRIKNDDRYLFFNPNMIDIRDKYYDDIYEEGINN